MPIAHAPLTLPAGMRSTRASQAVLALFATQPDAVYSEADVERSLQAQGLHVNRVTVYRLLNKLHAAGLLQRSVDAERIARYMRAPAEGGAAVPRFECDGCHQQIRLAGHQDRLQSALRALRQELQAAGHEALQLELAVRGRCAGCAQPSA
ncbi:Fur family transcriptional regulator [Comamonas endophytica]|uniref:Transcriptional repressor n=1 Tax=Comamonas endophytica TaxID=2949090 RepID=A0ABY6G983_9BURK|nr:MULTISPECIES: transcriptional repressor [unclassified Acidovorax]MCD2511869.1 transcriptional repressor [Acidovorax sp. D4N7]UYG51590.1 transcriptional repressor [Acidovorax sp. 5MLIR]